MSNVHEKDLCRSCFAHNPSDSFMIQCDVCNAWFHGHCCCLTEWQAAEIEKFHCMKCTEDVGPSVRTLA